MINKIKAEVERLKGIGTVQALQRERALIECLNWAEETKERILEDYQKIDLDRLAFDVIPMIKKAFNWGGKNE
jgi:hypothetical protein